MVGDYPLGNNYRECSYLIKRVEVIFIPVGIGAVRRMIRIKRGASISKAGKTRTTTDTASAKTARSTCVRFGIYLNHSTI